MSDSDSGSPLPYAGKDAAASEERDTPPAPAADPDLDLDDDDNVDFAKDADDADGASDNESELSDVDEAEFDEFDPATVAVDLAKPTHIDEDIARGLTARKRKRPVDGEGKKVKEGKREKKKKRRDEDEDPDGEQLDGKRNRKPKRVREDGERRERAKERRPATPENEEALTPEERRRRALERAMDAAVKNPNKRRRKKDEVDLEEAFDEEIAELKIRMEKACVDDNAARDKGQPAIHKLKLLPEVVALLNRNTVQHSIVDPDTNFLMTVRFFLEPLNDGSLPAYNIQRDLLTALTRLPIEKEALLSSGIGKVVLYYTKSKKPEIGIKRTAEKLLGEWSRPILKRTDDYKKRKIATQEYDHQAAQLALRPSASQPSQLPSSQKAGLSKRDLERERILAQPVFHNRARMETSNTSYTIAPQSTFDPSKGVDPNSRQIGAGGIDAFRRMTAKQAKKRG